jgi:hypothetical protein
MLAVEKGVCKLRYDEDSLQSRFSSFRGQNARRNGKMLVRTLHVFFISNNCQNVVESGPTIHSVGETGHAVDRVKRRS